MKGLRKCGFAAEGGAVPLEDDAGSANQEQDFDDASGTDTDSDDDSGDSGDEKSLSSLVRSATQTSSAASLGRTPSENSINWSMTEERMRQRWREWSSRANIQFGAKLVFSINCLNYVWLFAGIVGRYVECDIYPFFGTTHQYIAIPLFAVSTVGFGWSIVRPSLCVYLPSLLLWHMIINMTFLAMNSGMREYTFSCGAIRWGTDVPYADSLKQYFADGTRGYDTLEVNMVVILMSAYMIPQLRLMLPILWAWTAGFYFVAAASLRVVFNLDVAVAIFFLGLANVSAVQRKRSLDYASYALFQERELEKRMSANLLRLLHYMIPTFIVTRMLESPNSIIADHCFVSILFIQLNDFDSVVHTSSPEELLNFLNGYFTRFDGICDQFEVTKIETVGHEYVCAVGVTPEDQELDASFGHKHSLGRLVEAIHALLLLQYEDSSTPVAFQMGLHTGHVVAGIVGHKLPRFRLFGDTVNTAARMMQKGVPGECQFGQQTRDCLPDYVGVSVRGEVEMKGKGRVMTYLLRHGRLGRLGPARGPGVHLQRAMTRIGSGGLAPAAAPEKSPPRRSRARRVTRRILDEVGLPIRHRSEARKITSNSMLRLRLFDDVLQRMRATRSSVRSSLLCKWRLRSTDPVEEALFRQWFHEHIRCADLDCYWPQKMAVLILLTAFEVLYSYFVTLETGHKGCFKGYILYLELRAAAAGVVGLCILMSRQKEWVLHRRATVSAVNLACTVVLLLLMFFSYDSMSLFRVRRGLRCESGWRAMLCGVASNAMLLFFILYYTNVMTRYPHTFAESFAFPVLACVVLVLELRSPYNNPIFHSMVFVVTFALRSLVYPFEAYLHEQTVRKHFMALQAVHSARDCIHGILETMMPPLVLKELRANGDVAATQHPYEHATVAQSDLCGFTELASTLSPESVVEIIGELFGLFDDLTDKYDIYKVETVGDAYIAGQAEPPLTAKNSPLAVVYFALDMVKQTAEWSREREEAVGVRVGVHSGRCVGGIVGNDMQRYHLFGDIMAALDVLESTAPRGGVQISKACKEAIDAYCAAECCPCTVDLQLRDAALLQTSKGEVHQFSSVGGRTYLAARGD